MKTVDVTIAVLPETAARMADPGVRARVAAVVNHLLGPSGSEVAEELGALFAEAKQAAAAAGLTDDMIRAELARWKLERRARHFGE